MRLSDYVIDYIAKQKVAHIFMVSGGGGMFLIDSLGRRNDIKYVCNHHEQASTMAAEGYQRVTKNLGVALVTTGPAGTNTLTGLLCAWNDSIPLLIISGQANSRALIGNTGLRQRGTHEVDITTIVKSVTKYQITLTDAKTIRYHLEKAVHLAKSGRPGPVWVDIPVDIQAVDIDPEKLKSYKPPKEKTKLDKIKLRKLADKILNSKRPLILAGYGIQLAQMDDAFKSFIKDFELPVVTTKNAFDLMPEKNKMLAGRIGTYGQRAANLTVQNSDLLLILGSRLAFTATGYETDLFAREAEKILVDIDSTQISHRTIKTEMTFTSDIRDFLPEFRKALKNRKPDTNDWIKKITYWKKRYPPVLPQWKLETKRVNPYYFFEMLSDELGKNDILVTDQGATFYCSTPAFKLKEGQHAFTNGGFSPMGYGLPAAIGACFAKNKKRVVCVQGDGGLQMNIQELQTIVHHKLPVKLFVFNNMGYLSIKHTQNHYFDGFLVGSDPKSGVSCPDTQKIAKAYGIPSNKIKNHTGMLGEIRKALNSKGPYISEIMLDDLGPFMPRVTTEKKPDGRLVSKPLEDMWPFLEREEFKKQMIITPFDEDGQ